MADAITNALLAGSTPRNKYIQALLQQSLDSSPISSPWQGASRMANALLAGLELRDDAREQESLKAATQRMIDSSIGGGGGENLGPSIAPVASAPTAPAAGNEPRGYRNNNPLNIEAGRFTQGQAGFAGSDGRFAKFASMDQGVSAANKLLDVYQNKHGLNTPAGIVGRWASAGDGNNVGAYAANVARQLGIGPNDPISPEMRPKLIAAMAQHENGRPMPQGLPQPQPGTVQMAQAPDMASPQLQPAQQGPQFRTPQMTPQQREDLATVMRMNPALGYEMLKKYTTPKEQWRDMTPAEMKQLGVGPGLVGQINTATGQRKLEKIDTTTDDIKEFEYAKQQGFQGGLAEWMGIKRGGAGEYGLQPIWGVDENGNPTIVQLGKGGTAVQSKLPPGVKVGKDVIKVDAGTETILLDPVTRQPIGRISKNIEQKEAAEERGKATGQAQVGLPNALAQGDLALKNISQIREHPGRKSTFGVGSLGMVPGIPGTDQAGFVALVDQLKGKTFLQAFESLKGAGAITEIEGKKATDAIARLQRTQNDRDFDTALKDLEDVVKAGMDRAKTKAGGIAAPVQQNQAADPLGLR